jgi:hypothetical protein
MVKVFKITSRLVLVLGLIFLSFKPSSSNYVAPGTFHADRAAFSKTTAFSQRIPLSHRSAELRSSFRKNDDQRRLSPVIAVPLVDAFVFNVSRFNRGTSMVSFVTASSPSKTVVLRL